MTDPNRYATLSDDQLAKVHAACEIFEQAIRNERPISIEDCLAVAAEENRSPLFRELIAIELEGLVLELQIGNETLNRPAQIAEYHARFPDRSGDIERAVQETNRARHAVNLNQTMGRAAPERGPAAVPGYEIEGVLGRGGMGVIHTT